MPENGAYISIWESSSDYFAMGTSTTVCSSHAPGSIIGKGFDVSLYGARLQWRHNVPILVLDTTGEEQWPLVPSIKLTDFMSGNMVHHGTSSVYSQIHTLAHSVNGHVSAYTSIITGEVKYSCYNKEGYRLSDTDELLTLFEYLFRQMWCISDEDVRNLEALLERLSNFQQQNTPGAVPLRKGRPPRSNLASVVMAGVGPHLGVLDDDLTGVIVQFSPSQRNFFFKDITKISDEELDCLVGLLVARVPFRGDGADRLGPADLKDYPVYDWGSTEHEDSPYNVFLQLNRNRAKRCWSEYLSGSYRRGFVAVKGYTPPDRHGTTVHQEDTLSIEFYMENLFNKIPPFPRLPRYDITPFQAACLYSSFVVEGAIDFISRKPKIPVQWIWDPNLEEKLLSRIQKAPVASDKFFTLLQKKVADLVKGWLDSVLIYETYKEVAPVKPLSGYIDNLERVSTWNHLQEGKIPLHAKLKALGGDSALDDLVKPSKALSPKIDKYRVKKSSALILLGKLLHHCIGTQTKSPYLFFNHGTVCAKTDLDFTRVLECRDAHNQDTYASRRFKQFLTRAMGVRASETAVVSEGTLYYIGAGDAMDQHINATLNTSRATGVGALHFVSCPDGKIYRIVEEATSNG